MLSRLNDTGYPGNNTVETVKIEPYFKRFTPSDVSVYTANSPLDLADSLD
jgi:hypothetical protein